MKYTGKYNILGRGTVITMQTEPGDPAIKIGDLIPHDGELLEVRGIEMSWHLVAPPVLSPRVGFVVRAVKKTEDI